MKIKKLFNDQAGFSDLLGISKRLEGRDLDDLTRTLSLALHKEVSDLVSATSYRSHTADRANHDPDKILFESVDVIRYSIAIMNAWGLSPEEFERAWRSKDRYLSLSKKIEQREWRGEKVAIIDVDDVLCEFRSGFSKWLLDSHGIFTDVESSEYYFITELEETGQNPEKIFESFIADSGFLNLEPVDGAREFMLDLKNQGYFVHILTARPNDNLRCLYNTFEWLEENDIYFDKIDFSSEKFRWCVQSDYWCNNAIDFAVDDSPKHAAEYSKHGVKTFFPEKSYNRELQGTEGCRGYTSFEKAIQVIKNS